VVAFVSLLARTYIPLVWLSSVQVNMVTVLVSFERVFEILDLQPSINEKPNTVVIPAGPVQIAFEHVSFCYPAASTVALPSLGISIGGRGLSISPRLSPNEKEYGSTRR
jgi:ABC-type multidrug transport system fused ATPase/permease subunit